MPKIMEVGGFQIYIYTHDHEPMHVHVKRAGGIAIIEIANGYVRKSYGMSRKDEAKARQIVLENREFLADEWDRISPIP